MKQVLRWFLALAVVVTLSGVAEGAFAQDGGGGETGGGTGEGTFTSRGIGGGEGGKGKLFVNAEQLGDNTVGRVQQVVYGLGGLGAIALGALAFFGRFQWGWFFGLIGGLVLIAGLQTGIEYLTGDGDSINQTKNQESGN